MEAVLGLKGELPKRPYFGWIEGQGGRNPTMTSSSGSRPEGGLICREAVRVRFGTAKADARHLEKLANIYEPKLPSLVDRK